MHRILLHVSAPPSYLQGEPHVTETCMNTSAYPHKNVNKRTCMRQ